MKPAPSRVMMLAGMSSFATSLHAFPPPGPVPVLDVSVVIPCLNEANSLAFCIDKATAAFRSAGLRGEVVIADNGSTDGSVAIAGEHGARVVAVPQRGYGAALRSAPAPR